jgi:hypothetical protein
MFRLLENESILPVLPLLSLIGRKRGPFYRGVADGAFHEVLSAWIKVISMLALPEEGVGHKTQGLAADITHTCHWVEFFVFMGQYILGLAESVSISPSHSHRSPGAV